MRILKATTSRARHCCQLPVPAILGEGENDNFPTAVVVVDKPASLYVERGRQVLASHVSRQRDSECDSEAAEKHCIRLYDADES